MTPPLLALLATSTSASTAPTFAPVRMYVFAENNTLLYTSVVELANTAQVVLFLTILTKVYRHTQYDIHNCAVPVVIHCQTGNATRKRVAVMIASRYQGTVQYSY